MDNKLENNVSFEKIRYANCWEDAGVLLSGLDPRPDDRILSIASGGDNSFALLLKNPKQVVAFDLSLVQLHLIALKKAAIGTLTYHDCLSFLGFRPCDDRRSLFHQLQVTLNDEVFNYWEGQIDLIEKGIIHQGKFERYFQKFSSKILPLIHSRKTIERLFEPKSAADQRIFYDKKWNTFRWRMLFKLFFSKFVMGRLGRDPEFLKQVDIPVAKFIFNQAEQELSSTRVFENDILHYNLCGHFGGHLPIYLQKENFDHIKSNLDRLELFHGGVEEALSQYGQFNSMNLSDIFEYMTVDQFKEIGIKIKDNLAPGGRIAYWNLMVNRRLSQYLEGSLKYLLDESEGLKAIDKGFFYKDFIVEERV